MGIGSIGIIGGSGLSKLIFTKSFKRLKIRTKYGEVWVRQGKVQGTTVLFINRHGEKYIPPSMINYRANIAALKEGGAQAILATAAVGSIKPPMKPGDFVVLSDFIDFTKGRTQTFTDSSFIDLSLPYDPSLAKQIISAAAKLRIKIHPRATYACTEGPRFETKAEIRMFGKLGADVVGMTNVPEVVLANEAGIPYAVIGVVTNYAAGVSSKKVSAEEVVAVMGEKREGLSRLLAQVIKYISL